MNNKFLNSVFVNWMENISKKYGTVRVAVHNGVFHQDDVLFVSLLKYFFPETKFDVFRTRDPQVIDSCHIVGDVGLVDSWSTEKLQLDHHQKSASRMNFVKKAACGKLLEIMISDYDVLSKILTNAFCAVEAGDNGQEAKALGIKSSPFTFISMMNKTWMDEISSDSLFDQAVNLAVTVLDRLLAGVLAEIEEKAIVEKAIRERKEHAIVLPAFMESMKGTVITWNKSVPKKKKIFFYVFKREDETYGVLTVAKDVWTFESWKKFSPKVSGLVGDDLVKETGISDCYFIHKAGFFATFGSVESALDGICRHSVFVD